MTSPTPRKTVVTDAQVERAAAASWDRHANIKWSAIPEEWKPFYRDCARAALEAVYAGATP
jgi:hypothetical protein